MKSIKFFAVAAMMAIATSASAQFSTAQSSSSSSTTNTDGWSSFWVEWNPSTLKYDKKGLDDSSVSGFSIGYSQAFSNAASTPLFVEAGLGVQYTFSTLDLEDDDDTVLNSLFWMCLANDDHGNFDEDDDEDPTFNMFSVKVPVNLIYKFDLPNSTVSLMPFVGAVARYNLSAQMSYDKQDYDIFDKKDVGSSKATAKRFQMGWQIGLKARLGESFIAGVSYGSDFSEISKDVKVSTTTLSIGYTF